MAMPMQVATQQLQIRKADTDAEASSTKIRNLQSELQVCPTPCLQLI